MRKNKIGSLFVSMMFVFVSCTTRPGDDAGSQFLFDEEFNSLDDSLWVSRPSLTPFAGLTGSDRPGEVKVEDGILKLSRYAAELSGENPVSYVQTQNPVDLPDAYTATIRFKNEYTGLELGGLYVTMYHDKVWVRQNGIDGPPLQGFDYRSNKGQFFILSMQVTGTGYVITIKEDTANAPEETFSGSLDPSRALGDSVLMILGGSNTASVQYSEIDYIRITR
jgi:hypothetical protein